MNNETLFIKMKQRLNKLASNDYDSIECWQFTESFNKGQVAWVRRNLHGTNGPHEGAESSLSRIDDLQKLIVDPLQLTFTDKGLYFQSDVSQWPTNYLRFNRVDLMVTNDCCDVPKRMTVYLRENADINIYLDDPNIRPDYAWNETFGTISGNKLNIYHNNQFALTTGSLIYYRQPRRIEVINCRDPYTNLISVANVTCEFNDDLTEILIDEGAAILAGDIESQIQMQRLEKDVEKNN